MKKRSSFPYAVMLSLAAMLLTVTVCLFFGSLINREIDMNSRERIEEYASHQKAYISTVLTSHFSLLHSFATFLGEDLLTDEAQFARLSESLISAGNFDHVLFIDGEGSFRVDTGETGQGAYAPGLAAMLAQETAITPPFPAFFQNDELCMLLSVPVRDGGGNAVGLLCASYSAQHFGRLLLQDNYRDTAHSLLTDAEGNLLFSSSANGLYIPAADDDGERRIVPSPSFFDEQEAQRVRESMALREDNCYTLSQNGVGYVVVQTPLEQNGWLLFCMVPTQSLLSDYTHITHLRHLQICIILLIITACALCTIFMLLRERRQLRRENSTLSLRAATDSMTSLLNQAATRKMIEAALEGGAPTRSLLLLLDLDNLKGINDTLGHPIGDRAILMIANLMRNVFPNADGIGRIGGDEFMIFLRDAGSREQTSAQLRALQAQMCHAMSEDFDGFALQCSIGAAFAVPGDGYLSLYRRADIALYHVKRNGRNGFAFYEDVPPEER